MRLLLDEHHDPEVAIQLRRKGHDAIAVVERPALTGLGDEELLEAAGNERRVLVTEDVEDFMYLHGLSVQRGQPHFGIILTSYERYRYRPDALGPLIAALEAFLRAHPSEDALRGRVVWL